MSQPTCASSAHSVGFPTSSLAISQYCRVIPCKTAQNEVFATNIEQFFLFAVRVEHFIELEVFVPYLNPIKLLLNINASPLIAIK
jgi:hypothetical protein